VGFLSESPEKLSPTRDLPREKEGRPKKMTNWAKTLMNWATTLPAQHEVCLWVGYEIPMLPSPLKKTHLPVKRMGFSK